MAHAGEPSSASPAWSAFVIFIVGGLVVGLLLGVWVARQAVLLAFASAVMAVVLLAVARPVERYTGLGRHVALAVGGLALLALLGGAFVTIGSQMEAQITELREALPNAIKSIEERFGIRLEQIALQAAGAGDMANGAGRTAAGGSAPGAPASSGQLPSLREIIGGATTALSGIASIGSVVANALASVLIVLVGGFFLAAEPGRYHRGVVALFPKSLHTAADRALTNCGTALGNWLTAQLMAMIGVGLLTGLGAWAIGLPAPLAIGIFAGITEFIPILGPWLGAVPALLLAAGSSWTLLLWTGALFIVVQQLEANVITPLAQARMADVPPFLVLFGVIVFGLIFGLVGVIVSGPLTLVLYLLVIELYVKGTLGHDVELPGVKSDAQDDARPEARGDSR